ncbi:MAG: SOS response-associated peptidase [Desulfobulbaceae bacterium]|nr:SOS response-associated peptidase [Desulfobulbaceae bacterium]
MCGRFAYFGNGTFGYESLLLADPPPIEDYNIPPSRNILTIRTSPESGKPDYAMLRWGLVPFWSKTAKTKYLLNNARAEGIEKKPSFRGPIKHRRCIIPVSGFYEWLRKGRQKTPYFVRRIDGGYMAMGGIWDHWQSDDGQEVQSCSIITTEANKLMMEIHDRMPVILDKKDLATWLDIDAELDRVLSMLKPCPDSWIEAHSVSSRVNNVKNNGPECVSRSS